ncbi:hypothetical protein CUC11_02985 [Lacticaseibacillus rhamnosus]|nr:hypothetical protein CUC11_02985 [Lacticaseibacillus rhamnosus]
MEKAGNGLFFWEARTSPFRNRSISGLVMAAFGHCDQGPYVQVSGLVSALWEYHRIPPRFSWNVGRGHWGSRSLHASSRAGETQINSPEHLFKLPSFKPPSYRLEVKAYG